MAPKTGADEQSILEKISSKKGPAPKTPIEGFGERVKNMAKNNQRGILGCLIPLLTLAYKWQRFDKQVKLMIAWQWMVWFYLIHPVAVPVTSLIPIFFLPMAGIYDSSKICKCYMTEGSLLYITTSYLLVLFNNSGVDKRIALWFLCSGGSNNDQYSGRKLVLKASAAAFFLSMFSSRLIATFNLTQMITNSLDKAEKDPKKKPAEGESDVTAMRYIINNSIQTSASIGSVAIVHGSWVTLLFRTAFQECQKKGYISPDVFNYLQYSMFAVPLAFSMFIVNLIYHMILMMMAEKKGIPEASTTEVKKSLLRSKAEIPSSISLHETYAVVFTIALLIVLFTRYSEFFVGWAVKATWGDNPYMIRCKDTTVTAIFVVILHIIPRSFDFLSTFSANKRKELPHKPTSAILWWRFVDKNINYGYLFTIGSAVALLRAGHATSLTDVLINTFGMKITDLDWNVSILLCVIISAILCNIMTAMAACGIWLPYILLLAFISVKPWPTEYYIPALGIGVACNFGFCTPFEYTPAYYCHHTGKVPIGKMIRYSIPCVLICAILLYLFLILLGKSVFDPDLKGMVPLPNDDQYAKILAEMNQPAPAPGE